jgi:fatty-acyl-CoA synthase
MDLSANQFEQGLPKTAANYVALSPLSFIARSAAVYPDHTAVIHGDSRYSWAETFARCRRLASALAQRGVGLGDTVAVFAPNVPAMLEAHFGVPAIGAVLSTVNIRLDADTIAYILRHGEAKVLITDREFSPLVKAALAKLERRPLVIDIDDPQAAGGELLGECDYERFLAQGDPEFPWAPPADEWQAIALNYTSGTTGDPKGVVYHHRGAYLNAISNVLAAGMPWHPVYLWTIPMFHCNGWSMAWTIAAMAGVNVCLRKVEPRAIFEAIEAQGITHFSAAPIVLNSLVSAPEEVKRRASSRTIEVTTGGAPPPARVIEEMENLGMRVTHLYGLTEVYGPGVSCAWRAEWDALPLNARAELKARVGVRNPGQEAVIVADPQTLAPVPADGETMGEILFRGNTVMKGYFKDAAATERAFAGGWFHSGDLGVVHPDGYIQIRDRSKDVVISGGENISSIEVENVLYRHPAVLDAAVVARPDPKWGETPCAFVTLRSGVSATAEEIIRFCREHLAHFKAPKTVIFGELPKTSTGKVQKFLLREQAQALGKEVGA